MISPSSSDDVCFDFPSLYGIFLLLILVWCLSNSSWKISFNLVHIQSLTLTLSTLHIWMHKYYKNLNIVIVVGLCILLFYSINMDVVIYSQIHLFYFVTLNLYSINVLYQFKLINIIFFSKQKQKYMFDNQLN